MRTRKLASLAVVFLLAVLAASATQTGAISGVVVDTHGSALPGVAVHLSGSESKRTLTDAGGRFSFLGLRPGQYQLRFERAGFIAATSATVVGAGATERIKVRMSVNSVAEAATQHRSLRTSTRTRSVAS